MMNGFIKDKLEIKFLILYIAARVNEPLSLADLQGLTMIDDGIDYFAFVECVRELVDTEHLTLTDEKYAITAKGQKNSKATESEIPYSVRIKAEKELLWFNQEQLKKDQVKSNVIENENGSYTLELALNDEVGNVFTLQMLVPSKASAKELINKFQENPTEVYNKLLTLLNADDKEKQNG